ncbi:hypothetical protein C7212DRAFT_329385 [Tuber magnatum]|uniref:Uncharacterized protein n=1 Tax=Tuber magnatum TaxID=42249 RepID=A0A317SHD9_9PEZI|nr:hypothetical protein C7212DRAFT_329385 [Tuber magnatum]
MLKCLPFLGGLGYGVKGVPVQYRWSTRGTKVGKSGFMGSALVRTYGTVRVPVLPYRSWGTGNTGEEVSLDTYRPRNRPLAALRYSQTGDGKPITSFFCSSVVGLPRRFGHPTVTT